MLKQFLLRIFLTYTATLLLVVLWDAASARSMEPEKPGIRRETSEIPDLPDDDSSHQTSSESLAPQSLATDDAVIEDPPDNTTAQPAAPPLLSDIEPLSTISEALLPPAPNTVRIN